MATSYEQRMFDLAQEWAEETGASEIDLDKASDWAIAKQKYHRLPITPKQQCMRDMRRALQQVTYKDPQGNDIRIMHAVKNWKGQQLTLWIDIRTAKPEMMQEALQQKFDGIANDVKRHAIEKQSYDLNNLYGVQLSLFNYDFNAVAEDARQSGDYDDTYDDDFDEDLD